MQGWLGSKDAILHSGEGPIQAIKWAGTLIAWANDLGVKVHDTSVHQRIAYIERPHARSAAGSSSLLMPTALMQLAPEGGLSALPCLHGKSSARLPALGCYHAACPFEHLRLPAATRHRQFPNRGACRAAGHPAGRCGGERVPAVGLDSDTEQCWAGC